MAGNYRVRFEMQESTPWTTDYTPLEPKRSGGHEVVRVIEDTGRPLGRLLPEPVAERVTAWLRAVTPGTVTLVEGRVATASPTTASAS